MAAASHRVGKALVLREQGGPDAFTVESAWPASEPAEGEILVRLAATSVNPVDTYHRSGSHGHKLARVPEILGGDVAGTVVAAGEGAKFKPGDKVFALTDGFISKPGSRGTYSEFVTFPASWAAPAPVSLPLAAAAAVPLVALTAWQALERANPSAGQRLLILGSSGGVGQVAVQLAKVHGLHVTALASHRRAEVVASLGADEVFEYDRDEGGGAAGLGDRFSAPGLQFDIVFDVLGGEYLDAAVARALKPGGVVTVVRNRGLAADKMETYAAAARDGSGPALYVTLVEPNGGQLARVGQLIDEGKLRVVVAHQWPVERVADAHRLVEDGHAGGKVVLTY